MIYKLKNNDVIEIRDLESWQEHAGLKKKNEHWQDKRSSKECARYWLQVNSLSFPLELNALLERSIYFSTIKKWKAEPEAKTPFDSFSGPSNIDLLIEAEDSNGDFIIGVEAKADETFGTTIEKRRISAKKTKAEKPNSRALERMDQLVESLLGTSIENDDEVKKLRHQLFTGLAGTIAAANNKDCDRAIFLIQEFTEKVDVVKCKRNQRDLNEFITFITKNKIRSLSSNELVEPISITGAPLFDKIPQIFIGKITIK